MATFTITEFTARDKLAERLAEAATHPNWTLVFVVQGNPTEYRKLVSDIYSIHLAEDYLEVHLPDVSGPAPGGWTFFRLDDIARMDIIVPGIVE